MWVARDKSGILRLFSVKPSRVTTPKGTWQYENTWFINLTEGNEMCIDDTLFPDIKWEDEPISVDLFRTDCFPMTESYEKSLLEQMEEMGIDKDSYSMGMTFLNNFLTISNRMKWKNDK